MWRHAVAGVERRIGFGWPPNQLEYKNRNLCSVQVLISIPGRNTHTVTQRDKVMRLWSSVLTSSSSLRREYWGLPSLGGLDTWRCSESPLPTVSRHNTKATLSCNRLESKKKKKERKNGETKRSFMKPFLLQSDQIVASAVLTAPLSNQSPPVWSRLSSSQRLVPW